MDLGTDAAVPSKGQGTIQFRAEWFNFTNTPHFANPGGNVSNLVKNGDAVKTLPGLRRCSRWRTPAGTASTNGNSGSCFESVWGGGELGSGLTSRA